MLAAIEATELGAREANVAQSVKYCDNNFAGHLMRVFFQIHQGKMILARNELKQALLLDKDNPTLGQLKRKLDNFYSKNPLVSSKTAALQKECLALLKNLKKKSQTVRLQCSLEYDARSLSREIELKVSEFNVLRRQVNVVAARKNTFNISEVAEHKTKDYMFHIITNILKPK